MDSQINTLEKFHLTNKLKTDPNAKDKCFEKIEIGHKANNTSANSIEKKQTLKEEDINKIGLKTNPFSDNEIKNDYPKSSNKKSFLKLRNTNAIALDEATNTVGSLYSKITNADLPPKEKNYLKTNENEQENNNNNNDFNDKAYNKILKKQLFDYRRRIYVKTQHKIFLNYSNYTKSVNNLNKNLNNKLKNTSNNNSFNNLESESSNSKAKLLSTLNQNEFLISEDQEDSQANKLKTDYHRFFRVYSKHKKILPMIFSIEHFFTMGSPLSLFLTIERGRKPYLYEMETIKDFHNIIHPMDPVAYRIEHLIYDFDQGETSCLLPHFLNKGIKNVFVRKVLNLIFCNPENEMENEFYNKNKKRYDYMVQESIPEKTFHVIGFLLSHMKYWNNPDVFYFILDVVHSK
jgi:hypothetical protein